jgi:hypothetical protein
MSQNLTTYTIYQMPNITSPNLLNMKIMAKLAANGLYRATKTFPFAKFRTPQMRWLAILGWYRNLKSLLFKQLLFKRLGQIRPISQQHSAVIYGQFRQHFDVVNVGRGQFECLNHPQRIDFGMQSKSVKCLIANLFPIGGNTFEKLGKPGPSKSARRYRKAIDYLDNILEFVGNVSEKALFHYPQVGCMSGESNPAGELWEIVRVEIPEESKDVFICVKTKDFAYNFHRKYFTVSHLRQRSSGPERSFWEKFFHKIISFAEDIYDKIIKIHFMVLHGQRNNFCFLPTYSIGLRAFLLSMRIQKPVHGVSA